MPSRQEAIFFELHSGLPREAPGSRETTERAFKALPEPRRFEAILDVGCGPGAHSVQLAELSGAHVHAVDTHEPFLEALRASLRGTQLEQLITAVNADMNQLPFSPGSFDLIWSEGAAYIAGFDTALRSWKPLLRPGGCIALSELTWLRDDPPQELQTFWSTGYPGMQSWSENERSVRQAGYTLLESFALPQQAWWEYYRPVEQKIRAMRERYRGDSEALEVLQIEEQEIDLYRRYGDYYGYVFFVAELAE